MYVLSMTTTPAAWEGTRLLSKDCSRIRTALGLHPQLAGERKAELPLFMSLLPDARYVGEIGLDGSPEFSSSWSDQCVVFDEILKSCGDAGGRIMSIHSRRSTSQVLDRLAHTSKANIPILHWFSGTLKELERAMALGCWFSVGPSMLRSAKGRQLVLQMPRDRLLTESDGPFASFNNRSALPWDVSEAVDTLTNLWGISQGAAPEALLNNLRRLTSER
jgi:TatD DNase family protein